MGNIDDLNQDNLFKHLNSIFNSKKNDDIDEENAAFMSSDLLEDIKFFSEEELKLKFEQQIILDLTNIKRKANAKNLQALCSAALKNYKRDLITLHINIIKNNYNLKLTTRAADLFFIAFLGRSIGEKYLCKNFGGDFKGQIILTEKYKSKLSLIIEYHTFEVYKNLCFVIDLYKKQKQYIIYS